MSEFGELWEHEHNQHALNCTPEDGMWFAQVAEELQNDHIRYPPLPPPPPRPSAEEFWLSDQALVSSPGFKMKQECHIYLLKNPSKTPQTTFFPQLMCCCLFIEGV